MANFWECLWPLLVPGLTMWCVGGLGRDMEQDKGRASAWAGQEAEREFWGHCHVLYVTPLTPLYQDLVVLGIHVQKCSVPRTAVERQKGKQTLRFQGLQRCASLS